MDDQSIFDQNSDEANTNPADDASSNVLVVSSPATDQTNNDSSSNPSAEVTFEGNTYDMLSVIGVIIGGIVLLSCVTCNMAFYLLPFVPIILGIIGLVTAQDSVDPDRTKLLSWLSLVSGGIIFLLIALVVGAYFLFIFFMIAAGSGGGF